MKEVGDGAGITGIVGTMRSFTVDELNKLMPDENKLIADGLAAQDLLSRVRITLVKYENSPAHRVAFAPLLAELRSIVKREDSNGR